jgi:hypothetical protein
MAAPGTNGMGIVLGEAENAILLGFASVYNDSAASGGQAVQ